MKLYDIKLIGFFNIVIFKYKTFAKDKSHATKIASAIFNKPWCKSVCEELEPHE